MSKGSQSMKAWILSNSMSRYWKNILRKYRHKIIAIVKESEVKKKTPSMYINDILKFTILVVSNDIIQPFLIQLFVY